MFLEWLTYIQVFSNDINSPLKPPAQNKEGHAGNVNGRKASISQGSGNTFGVNSPSSASRPSTRRRETVDSNPFSGSNLASPTASRVSREDPAIWFQRKSGEAREDEGDGEQVLRDTQNKLPHGGLMRSNTSGNIGMSSIWPPSNQTTPSGAGGGGFGNFALPSSPAVVDKRAGGGSRLAHLIPKDNSENAGGKTNEGQNSLPQQSWRSRPRTDTDPFGDDELSGSAVLGGAQDTEAIGSSQANRLGVLGTPVKGSTSDFGMSGLNLGGQLGDNGPVSPSETNPYRSPPAERHGQDDEGSSAVDKGHIAASQDQLSNYATLPRGFGTAPFDGSDRSQTSSVGAKAYPLGGMSGWPAPLVPSTGTPDRERPNFGSAFGSSLFSPLGDLQSPGLTNLNVFGPSGTGAIGTGSIGRGSKLGSLFPAAMQAQMQNHEHDNNLADSMPDLRQANPLGAIGRGTFSIPARDTESPMRSNRGVFEELFPSSDNSRALGAFGTPDPGQSGSNIPVSQSFTPIGGGLPFSAAQTGAELPSQQVRQMVMPDRMRWVYLDPQGQVQGPFTGLEMNDWYKANFFTPDLRVKKVEDPEFEPLGQLIRRIGNSREPFLVPQIGIAHGPPMQTGPFAPANGNGIIPPLSGVFPSFGRTLTAEEQNNLERRKQEEQFLMAQQRDFVMRQQALSKFQLQGPGLQHHSSAHSLQSQPSFGSMTSPIGVSQQQAPHQQQQQPIGVMPPAALFEGIANTNATARAGLGNGELFRPDELANFSTLERQMLAALQDDSGNADAGTHSLVASLLGEGSLRYGLPDTDQLNEDPEGFRDRLREFENLRAQHDAEQVAKVEQQEESSPEVSEASPSVTPESPTPQPEQPVTFTKSNKASRKRTSEEAPLSLTEQVQKAQASATAQAQPAEAGMPLPFPPPSSTTPLPAPTAQRARSNLPEQFNRSQSGTPDVAQPPPLAPWAKDVGQEGQKGPSLKEIQEAEARKAAKAEEAAVALRKATMEQEAAILREKEKSAAIAAAAAAAAGLPATSTWGQSSPVSATSPWAKPGSGKGSTKGATPSVSTTVTSSSKKTLAEIQREEELRKQKAKEVATSSGTPISVSKSYANLAGKPNHSPSPVAQTPPVAGAGWATVGAGGKVKGPMGAPIQSQSRIASASGIKPVAMAPVKLAPKPMSISAIKSDANSAMDEFNKWAHRELSRGITGVNDSKLTNIPLLTTRLSDC